MNAYTFDYLTLSSVSSGEHVLGLQKNCVSPGARLYDFSFALRYDHRLLELNSRIKGYWSSRVSG
jgi:hypothetical protein